MFCQSERTHGHNDSENRRHGRSSQDRLERSMRSQSANGWSMRGTSEGTAQGLGILSLGLGSTLLLAPEAAAQRVGLMKNRSTMLRMVGLRELVSGIGLLTQPNKPGWAWSRVAGDIMDLALIAKSFRSSTSRSNRQSLKTAGMVVAGVLVADYLCARSLSEHEQERQRSGAFSATDRSRSRSDRKHEVRESVIINRSPHELYEFWRDLSNLPRFMTHLRSVDEIDDRRSHWEIDAPAGMTATWEAEVTRDEPGRRIAWRTIEPADVQHQGEVTFGRTPGNRGTKVSVNLSYAPPAGNVGHFIAKLLGQDPAKKMRDDLQLLKRQLETGEIPTTAGQPAGRTQGETWLDRSVAV